MPLGLALLYMYYPAFRFGSAIQELPSDIGEYFSSYFIIFVVVVFIFIFILLLKNKFFIYCKFFCQKQSYLLT